MLDESLLDLEAGALGYHFLLENLLVRSQEPDDLHQVKIQNVSYNLLVG